MSDRAKVLIAGICGLLLAVGVARFAYTPLLPLMREQAGLGVAEAGWLAAINYMGYLTGAIIASRINSLVLKDRLFRAGMLVAVISTAMMGLSDHWVVWCISRYIAGLSSTAGLLLGTGLVLNWLMRHHHRSEMGIHFIGVGLGIAGCAAAVALMDPTFDWRTQWFIFTGIATLLLIPTLGWLPPPDTTGKTASGQAMLDNPPSQLFLRLFMAAYFCAGIGYVVSTTFIVSIVDALPATAGYGNLAFIVVGLAAAPACINWDLIARRTGDLNALILAAVLQIIGILLPALSDSLVLVMLGAALFGGTFIGMVSLVLTMAGRYYPTRPAKMMGKMTVSYGVAQIIGPAITGKLAEHLGGSYAAGLWMAAGVMVVGTLILIALKGVERRDNAMRATAAIGARA